jgi:hypothetical protein
MLLISPFQFSRGMFSNQTWRNGPWKKFSFQEQSEFVSRREQPLFTSWTHWPSCMAPGCQSVTDPNYTLEKYNKADILDSHHLHKGVNWTLHSHTSYFLFLGEIDSFSPWTNYPLKPPNLNLGRKQVVKWKKTFYPQFLRTFVCHFGTLLWILLRCATPTSSVRIILKSFLFNFLLPLVGMRRQKNGNKAKLRHLIKPLAPATSRQGCHDIQNSVICVWEYLWSRTEYQTFTIFSCDLKWPLYNNKMQLHVESIHGSETRFFLPELNLYLWTRVFARMDEWVSACILLLANVDL